MPTLDTELDVDVKAFKSFSSQGLVIGSCYTELIGQARVDVSQFPQERPSI